MTKYTKEDYVVYGLDDATPGIIDAATRRRKKMWARLEAKVSLMAVSLMIITGVVVARFVIDYVI
jgi:hypothetical protein